ncbi:MAG: efflux transporter outer membrane subunit [Alphaproteobacteria bacterium]|nr:efflux transporter outer membrane subunit [Alphaproteobacteria bacterium]MBV8409818.1 efflux transporter outer membrane subunit [Alphaproteobacteria bacterium]
MGRGAAGLRAPNNCEDQLGRASPSCWAFSAVGGFLTLAATLSLGACMVGPNFTPADPPVAEQWLEAGNPSVKTDRQDYEQWWNAFNDPTLNNLIDRAYKQNLSLMAAGTRVLEARAALGVAIGQFYPQTQQFQGAVTYNQFSQSDATANPLGVLNNNIWKATLASQVGWELDFWGKFRRGVESASASYLASIATYDDVLVTLLGDVTTAYVGIRTLQVQLAIARENVVKQRNALQIALERYRGGASTLLDVYQAQNVLAQTESTIPQLTAQLDQGEAALRVLLGMAPESLDALLAGPQSIPVPPAEVAVGIPADLVRRRPDIRAAELQAAAQSAKIGMTKAQLFPAFSLTGIFGGTASSFNQIPVGQVFQGSSITFAFGPTFSWPVLNYGQITNQVRVQDAKLQSLLLEYQNAVLKAQKEVESNLAGFLYGRKQIALLRESVTAANNALTVAIDQYTLGTRDFTTVLTAEQNLYTAQSNLASAAGNLSNSLTNLYRALGGGWQIRAEREFVNDSVRKEMRNRTDWGTLLPPGGEPPNPTPGLPSPKDGGPTVRVPEF